MITRAGCVSKYITKSGERLWRYRFDTDPIDGRRQVVSKQGFTTRGAAMDAMRDAIAQRKEPLLPPPPAAIAQVETLAGWVRTWLRDYAPQRCTPKTIERYYQLAGYILNSSDGKPAQLAAMPLKDVGHAHGLVEEALFTLLRMPAKRKEHLSAKSVREIAGVLSVSLNKAFRLEKIDLNPLLRVELPTVERLEAQSLTGDQIQRLRDVCRGDWTFTFVEIALATGCRRGELLALKWPDVDWMKTILSISRSLEETDAGLRVKGTKNKRSRKFRLGQTAIAALRFQQDQQKEHRRLYGADYQDRGLIFCASDGSYLMPHLVSQTIIRRMKKAGIKDASLHTLRHSHASHLLSNHVPLPAVSARLGHADVNITARVYSHCLPDDDARAADAWETVICEDREKTFVTSCDVGAIPPAANSKLNH